ncbi:hypothetical protein HAX54_037892 [Datura stramonium]|uniref:Uncharacterized protein n=1 Tax=Datura stramonium TaxID=4076 RepID=A0ABS8VJ01_DATST|nr:hypothetical protein [Datura stramonium]
MPYLEVDMREWRERALVADLGLSALDAAMASPSTVRGPIDDLFEGLGEEEEPYVASFDNEEADDEDEE